MAEWCEWLSPSQHPNTPLTPEGRRRMVSCVLDRGWTVEGTAERFQVDAKTVRQWLTGFSRKGSLAYWTGRLDLIGLRTRRLVSYAGTVGGWLRARRNLRRWLVKLSGGIYIGLGAAAAFSGTRPATSE